MLQGHGHRCVSVSEFVDLGPAGLGLASHRSDARLISFHLGCQDGTKRLMGGGLLMGINELHRYSQRDRLLNILSDDIKTGNKSFFLLGCSSGFNHPEGTLRNDAVLA